MSRIEASLSKQGGLLLGRRAGATGRTRRLLGSSRRFFTTGGGSCRCCGWASLQRIDLFTDGLCRPTCWFMNVLRGTLGKIFGGLAGSGGLISSCSKRFHKSSRSFSRFLSLNEKVTTHKKQVTFDAQFCMSL